MSITICLKIFILSFSELECKLFKNNLNNLFVCTHNLYNYSKCNFIPNLKVYILTYL